MFSKNYDFHSEQYNNDFNSIVFSNVCQYLAQFRDNLAECEQFNQGILKKGIYSSVIKYSCLPYMLGIGISCANSITTSSTQIVQSRISIDT